MAKAAVKKPPTKTEIYASISETTGVAKKDVAALSAAVASANQAKKITEKPPADPQLQYWIEEAKKMPVVLESK